MINVKPTENSTQVKQVKDFSEKHIFDVSEKSLQTNNDKSNAFQEMLTNLYKESAALRLGNKEISNHCLNLKFGEDY